MQFLFNNLAIGYAYFYSQFFYLVVDKMTAGSACLCYPEPSGFNTVINFI